MRAAEAEARWPIMMSIPSIMNGACIMTSQRLNEMIVADRQVVVDDHPAADEQHEDEARPATGSARAA